MSKRDVDQLRQSLGGLVNASPIIWVGNQMAKLGETTQRLVGQGLDLLTTPPKAKDRVLPAEPKRKKAKAR